MVLAPLSHPFHMGRAAEVVLVFGFAQPTPLAGGFAGLSTWRLRTGVLAPTIAGVRSKEYLTVLTRALSDVTSHWPESPQVNDRRVVAWREENTEEKGEPKTAEEDGEETEKYPMWGRRRNGLHDNFNLAVYVQFLVAADIGAPC
jgi:hypothetical protein